MIKGLRCPNCDTTVHKDTIIDFLLNKKASHLRCKNAFCNIRWNRSALEANKAQFLGSPPPKPTPKPVEAPVKVAVVKMTLPAHLTTDVVKRVAVPVAPTTGNWLDRIRTIAQHHAQTNGVVSIDDLRLWADIHKDHPTSSSSWGSVFQGDQWKKVSEKNSTYTKSRSRKVSVWALKAAHRVAVGA